MGAITNGQLIYDPTDNESDKVGAYLLGADGTEITQTGGALDVNIASATDLDIRDLVFATDKVDVSGSAVTVSATDLDIRNLLFATDTVDVSGSAVTVSATDLDVRDLVFATDKVDVSGSSVSFAGFATFANPAAVVVGTTAVQLNASILANRKSVVYQNTGVTTLFLGDSGVTAAKGIKLPKGSSIELAYGVAIDMYAIGSAAAGEMRAVEAA